MGSLLNGGAHGEPKLRLVTPDEAPSDDRPDLQQASQQVEDLARHADLALESTHGITRELLAQDPALAERVGKVREKFEITLGKLDQLLPPDRKQRSLKPGEGDGPYRMIVHPEHQIQVAVDPVKVDPAKNAEILKMRLAELRDDLLPAFVNELSVRSLKIIGRLDAAIANVISEFNRSTADDSPLDFATHQNMLDIFQDEAILLLRHLVKRAASMPPEESGGLFRIADPQERWLQREVEAIVIRAAGYACALEGY